MYFRKATMLPSFSEKDNQLTLVGLPVLLIELLDLNGEPLHVLRLLLAVKPNCLLLKIGTTT